MEHSFGEKDRTLAWEIAASATKSKRKELSHDQTRYYEFEDSATLYNRYIETPATKRKWQAALHYTQRIGERTRLTASYRFGFRQGENADRYYNLNQWEATDKVLRTEFNEDNSKIDAALNSLAGQVAGKAAQSAMLAEKLTEEYEKGNYVIAGGDFNQTFDGIDAYPIHNKEDWVPGVYEEADIPEGFSLQAAQNVPTCRLLNAPYSGNYEDSQVYVIDGFLVSENLSVDRIENMDTEFEYSDHQPVRLEVTLKEDM